MLKPVNGNLLIEPLKMDSFVSSEKGTYQEVGIVIDIAAGGYDDFVKKGDRVYFDSWLAGKYPKNETEYFWLVSYKDVKAVETND